MGLFDKFRKAKEPERIREAGLIFCLEGDPQKALDQVDELFHTQSRGDACTMTLHNGDMEIALLAHGGSEENERGRYAREQLQGAWGCVYQNEGAPLEIRRNLMYHLRQCEGVFQVIFSFDSTGGKETGEKERQIRKILFDITAALQGVITFGNGLAFFDGQGRLILDREGKSGVKFYLPAEIPVPDDWKDLALKESLDRRDRSVVRLREAGIYVTPWLPLLDENEEQQGRTLEEVCGRAAALLAVALYSECRVGEKMSYEEAREFVDPIIEAYGADEFFSPDERKYLEDADSTEQTQIQYAWQYENLWVMEWALGLTDDLFWPDRICDVPGCAGIMQKYPDLKALIRGGKLRSRRRLLDEADLIYRLHWACVDARVMGLPAPCGVDAGVVMERHRALFWLAGCDGMCPWDDVDLST